jgi:thioredoxin 1
MNSSKVIHIDNGEFENQVLKSNIPVFVDFYADWCGPCRMVSPTVESLSNEYDGKIKFVKVNVDDNQELAQKYDILSIPTTMIFKKGQRVDALVGAFPAATYKKSIERILSA